MLKFLLLTDVLRKYEPIHILVDGVDSLKVVLNVHLDPGESLVDATQLAGNVADMLFSLFALCKYMVIAFMFLELQGFNDK